MAGILYLMGFFEDCEARGVYPESGMEAKLHMTVVPQFALPNNNIPEFKRYLFEVTKWFAPMTVLPLEKQMMGEKHNIPAQWVDTVDALGNTLTDLHRTILPKINELGGKFADPQFLGDNFTPHVAFWSGEGFAEIKQLKLIEHTEGFGKGIRTLGVFPLNEALI